MEARCGREPLRVRTPLPPLYLNRRTSETRSMTTLYFVLLLCAAVAFLIAVLMHYESRATKVHWLALALLLWVLVPLLQTARHLK